MAATGPSAKRIVFTGGSGVAGRHVVSGLVDHGYKILNIDLAPLNNPDVHTMRADLTQSGQVFNSFSSHFKLTQPFLEPVRTPDAVIHFAGVPRNLLVTDDELFRINTQSAYNVIEAACKLGVKKIILASSVTVYGVTFAEGHIDYPSFPIDESVDANPMDTYAMSKLCMERVARSFARRFGIDIYVLRLGAVIAPDEYEEVFRNYTVDADSWKAHGWSYTDVRDLAQMCKRCVEVDGLGFQVFNATNDEITSDTPTEEFLTKACPDTPFTRPMGKREAPLSNRKIKELLGFREEHLWQNYFSFKEPDL
jgi:nucleoside-diphosphate-sugar epimerase